MGKLDQIDKGAEKKGSTIVTVWQFIKFIFVSLIAMAVQFAVLNILRVLPPIQELYNQDFEWFVFKYTVADGGFGYFIAFNTANILAQIVAFFVNRKKTFGSDSIIAITLPIYIIFTLALICFSAWLSPTLYGLLAEKVGDAWAVNIATMVCSFIQFILYFPVDKLLFHKKKKAFI